MIGEVKNYGIYTGYLALNEKDFNKKVKAAIESILINGWKSVTLEYEGRHIDVSYIGDNFHVDDVTGRFE